MFFSINFYDSLEIFEHVISSSQDVSTYTGQHNVQTPKTNIHALGGIRTRDPVYQRSSPAP